MKEEALEYHKLLGKRLRESRQRCGLTQSDIGDHLLLTFQQIQKYEKGLNRIGPFGLITWAKLTNTPVQVLLDCSIEIMPESDKSSKELLNIVRGFGNLPPHVAKAMAKLVGAVNRAEEEV